jgi:hypothetical protein
MCLESPGGAFPVEKERYPLGRFMTPARPCAPDMADLRVRIFLPLLRRKIILLEKALILG